MLHEQMTFDFPVEEKAEVVDFVEFAKEKKKKEEKKRKWEVISKAIEHSTNLGW